MREQKTDILIIGGGPAGIAAASTTAAAGLDTLLVDDGLAPGGQIWRGSSTNSPGQAGHWLRALSSSGARIACSTRVVALPQSDRVMLETPDGSTLLRFQRAVLCPGARELFLPFPGWTLPGVTGAGGLQALVKNGLTVTGKQVVVAGSGPLLVAVAASLHKHGANILRIVEQTPRSKLTAFGASLCFHPSKLLQMLSLLPHALRVQPSSWVTRAIGTERVQEVVIRHQSGKEETIACDYLACGFNLIPNLELPTLFGCTTTDGRTVVDDQLATSRPNVWCAGEALGIGGVDAALIEGELIGHVLSGAANRVARLHTRRQAARRFADRLECAFALRDELKSLPTADDMFCRCEDATVQQVAACHSWREARLLTRCGMGSCQGRVCGAAARYLYGWDSATARPPLQPTSLEHLCAVTESSSPAASS